MVVPVFEEEITGLFYNTAAVLDSDGAYLGKYRKNHLPPRSAGLLGEILLPSRQPGLPGVRHHLLQIGSLHLLRPPLSRGRSRSRPGRGGDSAQSVGHRCGTVRVPVGSGAAKPTPLPTDTSSGPSTAWVWSSRGKSARFYGSSYFCNPRGQIITQGSRDRDEVITADLDLDEIAEVRNTWQFYRDRRPDTYGELTAP